ncbi:MAG: hypothetical protein ACYT04_56450 [Nostoc sp.]
MSDATKPLKRDITQRRFKVLSADPKGFDRDGDGIAYKKLYPQGDGVFSH